LLCRRKGIETMKKVIFGAVLAVVVAISLGGCGSADAQTKGKGDRWEYTVLEVDKYKVEKVVADCNKLGEQGWEYVGVLYNG
jgi:hypothetical protein